eukprot:scaffold1978_cov381-Prasinococcus_capsulatus_cf.AAC.17
MRIDVLASRENSTVFRMVAPEQWGNNYRKMHGARPPRPRPWRSAAGGGVDHLAVARQAAPTERWPTASRPWRALPRGCSPACPWR